jgi:uncharacterized protein YndB with AHSA1/START domain
VTRIRKSIRIRLPVEEVFDYATTPGNRPAWHPSSLRVYGTTDHSLKPGEQVTEEHRVAGRGGRVTWTAREHQAPRRWLIDGRVEGGGSGTIAYALTPHPEGTASERDFLCAMPNPLLAVLDRLTLRRRVEAESAEAPRRSKDVLERRAA